MSYNPYNPDPIFDETGQVVKEPEVRFPVLYMRLTPGDKGFDEGYRFVVEQLDEEVHYFRDREASDAFIIREGLDVIDDAALMKSMRERGDTY